MYDGPGVTTQTHTPEEGFLCVVKRHTHTAFKHKKPTKIQNCTKTDEDLLQSLFSVQLFTWHLT